MEVIQQLAHLSTWSHQPQNGVIKLWGLECHRTRSCFCEAGWCGPFTLQGFGMCSGGGKTRWTRRTRGVQNDFGAGRDARDRMKHEAASRFTNCWGPEIRAHSAPETRDVRSTVLHGKHGSHSNSNPSLKWLGGCRLPANSEGLIEGLAALHKSFGIEIVKAWKDLEIGKLRSFQKKLQHVLQKRILQACARECTLTDNKSQTAGGSRVDRFHFVTMPLVVILDRPDKLNRIPFTTFLSGR